jgi:hypothetical protein
MAKWKRRTLHSPTGQGVQDFDLPRFVKLCAMLASSHEGERASAALKASDMLNAIGLTWSDMIKDRDALLEHVNLPNAEDTQARARRFWKGKIWSGPPQQSTPKS